MLARVHNQLELKRARDRLRDQNVFLEAEIVRRMSENLLIQDVSIRALARLAEIRDPETGNHVRRTQAYVEVLARSLAARSTPCRPALTPEQYRPDRQVGRRCTTSARSGSPTISC